MEAGIRERVCVRGVSRVCAYLRLRVGAAGWEVCRAFSGRPSECSWSSLRLRMRSVCVCTVAALTALAAFTMITVPLAYARTAHSYESVITEVPAEGPAGKVPAPGGLEGGDSLTIHSDDLYVAEHLEGEQGINGNLSRSDQFAPSASKPGEYDFVSQLPPQPEPGQTRDAGIAFGSAAGEMEMYLGQRLFPPLGDIAGVNVFAAGSCGKLECATLQKELWRGAAAPSPFEGVSGVAVDHSTSPGDWASGDVFVVATANGEGVVDVFEPRSDHEEHYVGQVTGTLGPIAVSGFNGDLVVGDKLFRPVEEGPKEGKYVFERQLVPPGGALEGVSAVAVDDSSVGTFAGEIYVAADAAVYEFGPEGAFRGDITGVPKEGVQGGVKGQAEEVPLAPGSLAVDPGSHRVFVGQRGVVDVFGPDLVEPDVVTEAPSNLVLESDPETGATAWRIEPTGSVNPREAGVASCAFVWGLTETFGQEASCAAPVPNGASPVHVHGTLTSLAPDTAYVYRLQAKNEQGTNKGEVSEDYRFTTPGPGLRSESVSDVSSSGASFEATVAPHDAPVDEHDLQAPAKSPTSYFFQYSTQQIAVCVSEPAACASVPSAPVNVGSGTADVPVSQHATGLTPGTTYHYRLVAINEAQPAAKPGVLVSFYGPDRTFTTQGTGGAVVLPDGRAWELVSPADKHGARILPSGQASVDGGRFTFLTDTPTEPEPPGAGFNGIQVLSSRVAPGQWESVDINLSRSSPEGGVSTNNHEYRYFSPDFGSSIVEPEGPFSIPEGSHLNAHGEWERIVETSPVPSERTPYVRHNATCTAAPSSCFEPLLDSEDVTSGLSHDREQAAVFSGATPDAQHALIGSSVQLTSAPAKQGGLYEWSAGKSPADRLSLVNVVPETGEPGPRYVTGLSPDGSRVLFAGCTPSSGSQGCGSFYVRDVARGETARLDLTENGSPPPPGQGGAFEGASTDLSKVFFTDPARLTKDSGLHGADLYVCELGPEGSGAPKCALTDLTPVPAAGRPGGNEDAQVSRALGVSPDGSYVYFLAKGVQAAGATPGEGQRENLYVAHEHEGKWVTSFIASANVSVLLEGTESVVSPDGRRLAFTSPTSLTGYDNRDAKTSSPDSEVYLYDAETGTLICASCNPSGARPTGPAVVPISPHRRDGSPQEPVWQQEPGARSLFDGGRLFFDSGDALVPQDTNDNVDVYEFEPAGLGSCTAADTTFDPARGGCVGLISSGRASGESVFLEASADASDVFFSTSERLVGKDNDTDVDIYDAHDCSSASPCASEATAQEECASASACRLAPLPQPSIFGPPSSATFTGPGKLTPGPPAKPKSAAQISAEKLSKALASCRHRYKRRHMRRAACEKQAHKAHGPAKKAKKARKSAHANRRVGR
jgi:hypothetical protein